MTDNVFRIGGSRSPEDRRTQAEIDLEELLRQIRSGEQSIREAVVVVTDNAGFIRLGTIGRQLNLGDVVFMLEAGKVQAFDQSWKRRG